MLPQLACAHPLEENILRPSHPIPCLAIPWGGTCCTARGAADPVLWWGGWEAPWSLGPSSVWTSPVLLCASWERETPCWKVTDPFGASSSELEARKTVLTFLPDYRVRTDHSEDSPPRGFAGMEDRPSPSPASRLLSPADSCSGQGFGTPSDLCVHPPTLREASPPRVPAGSR